MLADCVGVLADHGLRFVGSLNHSIDVYAGASRLIVADDIGSILPECCRTGWWLISPIFTQEVYGTQKITRVTAINVVGELIFAANGDCKIKYAA